MPEEFYNANHGTRGRFASAGARKKLANAASAVSQTQGPSARFKNRRLAVLQAHIDSIAGRRKSK